MSTEELDEQLIEAIKEVAASPLGLADRRHWAQELAETGKRLSHSYRGGPPLVGRHADQQAYTYLPLYVPRYVPRLRHALRVSGLEVSGLIRRTNGHVRLLDLGCGPGTFVTAWLDEFQRAASPTKPAEVTVVGRDMDEKMLKVAQQFVEEELGAKRDRWPDLRIKVTWEQGGIPGASGEFDVVFLQPVTLISEC